MGTKSSRLIRSIAGAAAAVMLLTACGGGGGDKAAGGVEDTKADKGLPVVGDHVKYDPNTLVNDGKPISLDWWAWANIPQFQAIADAYKKIHPNVTINVVNQPWDNYWTKLPLAVQGKDGPTLFNIHNSHHENLIEFLEPYDIPTADLEADFVGVGAHVIDGKVYYIDWGIMTGAIYYNTDMWKAAGLTDADIPKTWEQFREIAKKLTIRDGDTLKQAGFNFNGSGQFLSLGVPYQYGQNLFASDEKTPTVNTETGLKVMNMFLDMYKDGSGDPNFGPEADKSFGQGQSAMTYQWGHYANNLDTNYPDIHYKTFQTPIPDASATPYAFDRYNGESTLGINKNASAEQKAVAQDFLKFYLTSKDSQKELCLALGVFPTYKAIAEDPEFKDAPAQSAFGELDHYIWPGPMPATFEDSLKAAWQDIEYNGVDPKTALETAQANIERDLEGKNFVSVENLYAFFNGAK